MTEMLSEIKNAVDALNERQSDSPAPEEPTKKHRLAKGLGIVAAGIVAIAVFTQTGGGDGSTYAEDRVDASSDVKSKSDAKPKVDMTMSQEQAVASAMDYLEYQAFSKTGLEQQLSSKYGDGFSKADAKFAVNHIDVNWNAQAVASAKDYLEIQSYSKTGLTDQLESKYGEQFTHAQAVYGVSKAYK